MALTRLGPNQLINLASNVTGTLPAGNGGTGSTTFSPGKVGQVVYGEYNQAIESSAGGFIDSGLTASITPSATSSKILVMVTQQTDKANTPTAGYYFQLRLQRQIASGGYSDVKYVTALGNYHSGTNAGDKYIGAQEYSLHHLDTTNTTSQVDYKTITNAETGMVTNPDDTGSADRGEASMILMEILA